MVILNKNKEPYELSFTRFAQGLDGAEAGFDVVSGARVSVDEDLTLTPMTPLILELEWPNE